MSNILDYCAPQLSASSYTNLETVLGTELKEFRRASHGLWNYFKIQAEINSFEVPKNPAFIVAYRLDDPKANVHLYLPNMAGRYDKRIEENVASSVHEMARKVSEIHPFDGILFYIGQQGHIPIMELYRDGKHRAKSLHADC